MFWQCNLLSTSGLIVFVFESVLCLRYCSHYLLFEVRVVQDIIDLSDELPTHIQLFARIHLRKPRWII